MLGVFLVLPQQFLLLVSAIGAIFCVIDVKFADSAVYPRLFIFVDQIYLVLLCVAHGWQAMAFGVTANLLSIGNITLPVYACRSRQ